LRADQPLAEATRRVLKARLRAVRQCVRPALNEWEKDPEHVHQLRVGTRRAAAALQIFRSRLRRECHKRMRQIVRRLRRAAGAARDWDVFEQDVLAHLEKSPPSHHTGLQFLLGHTRAHRQEAQARLVKKGQGQEKALALCIAQLPTAVRLGRESARLADLARPLLTRLIAKLSEAGRKNLTSYDSLHRVRIAGKRLRYALEVFACCFGRDLADVHYPRVERLQDILGEVNDSRAASRRLEQLRDQLRKCPAIWRPCRPGIDALLRYHQGRLPRLRREFTQWWRDWRKSGGQALMDALACP
jgi:CHAD domain-containing protein